MEERRKFVRLDTRVDINCSLVTAEQAQRTVTKNIGGSGICIISEELLPIGSQLRIAMKLPGRERQINFVAEVIWSESYEIIGKSERRKAVESGLQFVQISSEDKEAIMQHVILGLRSVAA